MKWNKHIFFKKKRAGVRHWHFLQCVWLAGHACSGLGDLAVLPFTTANSAQSRGSEAQRTTLPNFLHQQLRFFLLFSLCSFYRFLLWKCGTRGTPSTHFNSTFIYKAHLKQSMLIKCYTKEEQYNVYIDKRTNQ